MKKNLKEMVSANCYDEIISNIKSVIKNDFVFKLVGPTIIKAIEDGGKDEREEILINWLDCCSCRVCDNCGTIMEEGWYDEQLGYDCSDECAAKRRDMTSEEFKRYRIYEEEVAYEAERDGKNLEDLTQEEVEDYIETIANNCCSCYTQWC